MPDAPDKTTEARGFAYTMRPGDDWHWAEVVPGEAYDSVPMPREWFEFQMRKIPSNA